MINNIIDSFLFNNFIRFFVEAYLEITFAAVLNVAAWSDNNLISIISLGCALAFT